MREIIILAEEKRGGARVYSAVLGIKEVSMLYKIPFPIPTLSTTATATAISSTTLQYLKETSLFPPPTSRHHEVHSPHHLLPPNRHPRPLQILRLRLPRVRLRSRQRSNFDLLDRWLRLQMLLPRQRFRKKRYPPAEYKG